LGVGVVDWVTPTTVAEYSKVVKSLDGKHYSQEALAEVRYVPLTSKDEQLAGW
jgi:hypothetical protein